MNTFWLADISISFSVSKSVCQCELLVTMVNHKVHFAHKPNKKPCKKGSVTRVVSVQLISPKNVLIFNLTTIEMKVAVDKQVNGELEAIKKEMDYSGEVGARVKVQVQLDIVCKHILEESKGGNPSGERSKPSAGTSLVAKEGKKEKIPETKSESSAEIELPWISDLEPSSSKVCMLQNENTIMYLLVMLTWNAFSI